MESDVGPVKEQLAQSLFDHIPVGVGSKGVIPTTAKDLEEVELKETCSLLPADFIHEVPLCISSSSFVIFFFLRY